MALERIVLTNFRSYKEGEFNFSPEVTVITGKNGAGKTNILEAVYVLLKGRSFRDSDEELIRHDEEWWKIVGVVNNSERELRYKLQQPRPKQFYIDGAPKGVFTQKQQLPVVLFEPDDLLLLHGSPSRRRVYIDDIAAALTPGYWAVVNKYERALMQRNRLLKKGGSAKQMHDGVFVWDIMLAEYGAEIQKVRRELLEGINRLIETEYNRLVTSRTTLSLHYRSALDGGGPQEIAQLLSKSLQEDTLRGFTSVGPHRDDVIFLLNSKDARTTASRGEVRTILLSLKQTELDLYKATSGRPPLFLLDDVLSELDDQRQAALLNRRDNVQTIITTTHAINDKNVATIQLPSREG